VNATIKDVAQQAGVSVATVSRVINGKSLVREQTRRRVREVVERLRYAPHGAARSLITRSTQTIGVLLPDLFGEFFSELIRGIDLAARERGYHLLVSSSHSEVDEIRVALTAMRGRVDGIIAMFPTFDFGEIRSHLPATTPIVLINSATPEGVFSSIRVDNYGGASLITRHLTELGHRRCAVVLGPEGNHDARERQRGVRDTLTAVGAEFVEFRGDFTEDSGHRAGQCILARAPRPTAILAANDSMAIGCLAALREAGVDVPREISLVGFDDVPVARFMAPPLCSVSVDIAGLGARALAEILRLLGAGPRSALEIPLPTHLVHRASCAPPLNDPLPTRPDSKGGHIP
jgi:LacI family transcriptional regulator